MSGCAFFDFLNPESYTVTFVVGGEADDESVSVTEGKKVAKPKDPTREGYAFLGWYEGDAEYDFDGRIYKDKALTARWQKLHTVTFDTYGFCEVAPAVVADGDKLLEPTLPAREGFRFGGWFSGGKEYDFSEPEKSYI